MNLAMVVLVSVSIDIFLFIARWMRASQHRFKYTLWKRNLTFLQQVFNTIVSLSKKNILFKLDCPFFSTLSLTIVSLFSVDRGAKMVHWICCYENEHFALCLHDATPYFSSSMYLMQHLIKMKLPPFVRVRQNVFVPNSWSDSLPTKLLYLFYLSSYWIPSWH